MNESMFSQIDLIRQDSKDVRDFVKKVFSDREFKSMSKDTDFIKYLKSIYEGTVLDEEQVKFSSRDSSGNITTTVREELTFESVNEIAKFAGWVAIDHKGKRLEIKKSEAKDLYNAKLFAIKKLKVPKSKESMLVIKPGYNESVVSEEQDCWDTHKVGNPKTKISSKTGKRVNNCVPKNESTKLKDLLSNKSVSESVSKEAMGIAGFTGTRGKAVQNFIDDYSLNSKKLFKYISKADLKKRLEFVNAIAGTRGNKNQGKIVGMFGESVSEGDGLWANIRAKKARGEKPASKNSKAHKDAVKAGEKINKEESVVKEAKFGYKDSKATYITKHKDEYKTAEKLNKGNEVKFYDTLSQMEDKIGHPKFMIFLSNALRGYTVDMYKDPKIKNPQDAQEALFLLSK